MPGFFAFESMKDLTGPVVTREVALAKAPPKRRSSVPPSEQAVPAVTGSLNRSKSASGVKDMENRESPDPSGPVPFKCVRNASGEEVAVYGDQEHYVVSARYDAPANFDSDWTHTNNEDLWRFLTRKRDEMAG